MLSDSRYELRGLLGQGGMGTVYRVHDRERQCDVALKTIRYPNAASLLRFKEEFRTLAGLCHPNLVTLHELGCSEGRWFFTMELVEGLDFLAYNELFGDGRGGVRGPHRRPALADEATATGRPAPCVSPDRRGFASADRLRQTVRDLVAGLRAAHVAGKVHGDIKPSNVLVTRDGRVVVLDFGLVQDLAAEVKERPFWTPTYAAPELVSSGERGVGNDTFAVGVMLYQALTGRSPFPTPLDFRAPPPPRALNAMVPDDLDALCLRLLALDPTQRPDDDEILAALEQPEVGSDRSRHRLEHTFEEVFVGRTEERELLVRIFEEARRDARPACVLVSGPSGIGKTALLDQVLHQLALSRRALVLRSRCAPRESIAFNAFDSVIDDLTICLGGRSLASFAGCSAPAAVAAARLFPVLADDDALPTPSDGHTGLERRARYRAFEAIKAALRRCCADGPVIIAIDDLHRADRDSVNLLQALLTPPGVPPICVVGTMRDDEGGAAQLLSRLELVASPTVRLEALTLPPLTDDTAQRVVRKLLRGHAPLDEAWCGRLARQAAGNPLYLREMAFAHARSGTSPSSVEEAIVGRLERLGAPMMRLLETVAVAGYPLRVKIGLRVARGLDPHVDSAALSRLLADRWLRHHTVGESYAVEVYHDRIRSCVLDRMTPTDRADVHAALARGIEALGAYDRDSVAMHLAAAGDHERASGYAFEAARQAEAQLAFDHAANLYRIALRGLDAATPQQFEARLGLARTLSKSGRAEEAGAAYLEAAESACAADAPLLRLHAAENLLMSGRVEAGMSALLASLRAVGVRVPRTTLVGATSALGSLLLRIRRTPRPRISERSSDPAVTSRLETILQAMYALTASGSSRATVLQVWLQGRFLAEACRAGSHRHLAAALHLEALARATLRRPATVAPLLDLAQDALKRGDDKLGEAIELDVRAALKLLEYRYEDAVDLDYRCIATISSCKKPYPAFVANVQSFTCQALRQAGRLRELSVVTASFIVDFDAKGDRFGPTLIVHHAVLARLAADDVVGARHIFERASANLWHPERSYQRYFAAVARSLLGLYEGRPGAPVEGLAALKPFWANLLPEICGEYRIDQAAYSGRIAVAALAQQSAGARPVALKALRRLNREGEGPPRAIACLVQAGLALLDQDERGAVALLQDAMDAFRLAKMPLDAASARRLLGLVQGGAAGAHHVREADAWLSAEGVADPARFVGALWPILPRVSLSAATRADSPAHERPGR